MTEEQIQAAIQQARAAGYPEDQIQAKAQEARMQDAPPAVPQTQPNMVQNLIGSITKPFVDTGKTLVGGLVQVPLSVQSTQAEAAARNQALPAWIRSVAGKVGKTESNIVQGLGSSGVGLNPQETAAVHANPGQAQVDQLKRDAAMASYAIPFGKGANIATKALIPGAAVGGLQGISEPGATPESVVGSAVTGGTIAGVFHGAGKLLGPTLEKLGLKAEEVGGNAQSSVRKIHMKPSIYSAAKEKEINATLDALGITGSPQKQYELLQPKVAELGTQIDNILSAESKPIKISSIVSDFQKNLDSEIRGKVLSSKVVKSEAQDYIQSLYNASGNKLGNSIESRDLFALKQAANKDFSRIADKLFSGQPLTPAEQVQAVARKTFDDIITENHPAVKTLTRQQSNLYDAAKSLSAARQNPPTLRLAGTSIPGAASQRGMSILGKGTSAAGKGLQDLSTLPPILMNPNVEKGATIIGTSLPKINVPDQNLNNTNNGDSTQNIPHTPSIPTLPPISGYTNDQLATGYTKAIAAGDTVAANRIKDMYDMQTANAKSGNLSTADQTRHDNLQTALSSLEAADINLGVAGGAKGPLLGWTSTLPVIGGVINPKGASYHATKIELATQMAKAITGGSRPAGNVIEQYMESLPDVNDTPEFAQLKLNKLRNELLTQAQSFGFNDLVQLNQ
jgi:hypothetical protein